MKDSYLLKTKNAEHLYFEYAKDQPIIDFHNHLSVSDVAADRKFENLAELWLAPDPYKHRLMRICGVEEKYITGDSAPHEKFKKYCEIFPRLVGNPVYDWSRMELSDVFGIDIPICQENAEYIYDRIGEMLSSPEYSSNAILKRFNIEKQFPVASLTDGLAEFDGESVAPSLRGDNLLEPTKAFTEQLAIESGIAITDTETYFAAVGVMLDRFDQKGCRFADHALDAGFFDGGADSRKAQMLVRLGTEYAKRGWTLLLHLDAKRQTSSRLANLAGPAGGYAAVGGQFDISALCDLLNDMERVGGLPDTVLFPLNMNDQMPLAVLQGSFSQDGVPSKVQLGPAWWWCDHALGIENTLDSISSFGVVSEFIGMTTDSRSILSFVRHDYFRRLLCSWIDRRGSMMDWDAPLSVLGEIVRKICYENVKKKTERKYEKI